MNSPAINTAGYIAFCEGWVPNNEWGATTPNKVTSLTGSDAVLTFATPVLMNYAYKQTVKIQILNPVDDASFWADSSKVGGGTLDAVVQNGIDSKDVWLIVDASNQYTATIKE